MGTKPKSLTPINDGPPVNEAANTEAQVAAKTLVAVNDATAEGLAFGEQLGRLQAFGFMATVANAGQLAAYESSKKSKTWMTMKDPRFGDGRHFEDFDDFCQAYFSKSYRRLRELIANRNLLGQELFDQAESLGLQQRDYNAMKALPAPTQELVKEAIAEGTSRDDVLRVLRDVAAQSGSEIARLEKLNAEAKKEHAALDKRLEVVTRQKTEAEDRAARIAVETPDETLAGLKKEATDRQNQTVGMVRGDLRQALIALANHGDEHDQQRPFMAGLVGEVQVALHQPREEFDLPELRTAFELEQKAASDKWFQKLEK